ncbi:hypothetical protein [Geodermatophilus maliterrae]|uniref:ABM domain-containing protein n=1 Tax=Geodermatophilus maliterrae TaxID=3162531 RepID=A0ABV3XBR8_9ACTN
MPRVLLHVVHHPHPEHLDDLLAAMRRLTAAAEGLDGLEEIGAFLDRDAMQVIAISVWSSAETLQAGSATLFAGLGDVPFDEWERRPSELLTLPEVAGG